MLIGQPRWFHTSIGTGFEPLRGAYLVKTPWTLKLVEIHQKAYLKA
jgi:hypothetical protein